MTDREQLLAMGRRIRDQRVNRGLSQEELAIKVGYKSRSSINKIELGLNDIGQSTIKHIAEVLHTTTAYIMDGDNTALSIPGVQPLPHTNKKPRLGRIACGAPILAEENFDGYDDVPDNVHCDFTLLCQGDSMTGARIYDGDIVYIRQQPTVENGEIAAVIIDGEATLKRFYQNENTVTLMPENPAYAPLVYVNEQLNDIRIVGKAVAFTSMIR